MRTKPVAVMMKHTLFTRPIQKERDNMTRDEFVGAEGRRKKQHRTDTAETRSVASLSRPTRQGHRLGARVAVPYTSRFLMEGHVGSRRVWNWNRNETLMGNTSYRSKMCRTDCIPFACAYSNKGECVLHHRCFCVHHRLFSRVRVKHVQCASLEVEC